eukprot:SAG11_NODE_300_length_11057_cov_5.223469_14_plen_217_part_00
MQGVAKYASSCCGASPTAYVINTTVGGKTFTLEGDNGRDMNIPLTVLEVYNVSRPRTLPCLCLCIGPRHLYHSLGATLPLSLSMPWSGLISIAGRRGRTRAPTCQPPSPQRVSKAARSHSTAKLGVTCQPTAKARPGAARNAAGRLRGTITAPPRRARRSCQPLNRAQFPITKVPPIRGCRHCCMGLRFILYYFHNLSPICVIDSSGGEESYWVEI